MHQREHNDDRQPKALAVRLDRWAGEMNAFLMVFAVGLAVLYGTCFFSVKLTDAILHGGPNVAPSQQIAATVR